MAVVLGKRLTKIPQFMGGSRQVGLWVVFDDQVHDAIQLLENRKHTPTRQMSLSEMKQVEDVAGKIESENAGTMLGRLITLMVYAIIVFIVAKILWAFFGDA